MLELADRLVGIYKTRDVTKSVTMRVATPRPLRARDRPRPLCACSAPSPRHVFLGNRRSAGKRGQY